MDYWDKLALESRIRGMDIKAEDIRLCYDGTCNDPCNLDGSSCKRAFYDVHLNGRQIVLGFHLRTHEQKKAEVFKVLVKILSKIYNTEPLGIWTENNYRL